VLSLVSMDGLGIAASAFAIISLSIQLAESVVKIHDFYKSYQNASAHVNQIVDDLALLQTVFSSIADA
jgi:hypothetical protein